MIIPKYWAESKKHQTINKRSVTLKRFGWSDESQEAALSHAETRVEDAFVAFKAGSNVHRMDRKTAYNGADGLPIREEIVAEHGSTILTRNGYGAICLNTPNVLFADIDFKHQASGKVGCGIFLALAMIIAGVRIITDTWAALGLGLIAAAVSAYYIAKLIFNLMQAAHGGAEGQAKSRVAKFSASRPELHLRLYRTPMGMRVLCMNTTFEPQGDEAQSILSALESDDLYSLMCRTQNCFRARLTPKPWRMGMERIKSHSGTWPFSAENSKQRRRWVYEYEKQSRGYAACEFIEALGEHQEHPEAKAVQILHDRYCQVGKSLPLA